MSQQWADYRIFWREFRRTFESTGAVLPSGRALSAALCSYVRDGEVASDFGELSRDAAERRILEVGPGTGAVTGRIVRDMRPTDRLVLVERNAQFVDRLRERLANDPRFSEVAGRIKLVHAGVEELPDEEQFDLIISGLPLNNFSVSLVETLLTKLRRLLAPGGTLSFFEYVAVRSVKALVSRKSGRERLRAIGGLLGKVLQASEIRRECVLTNTPPAWVHHVRSGDWGLGTGDWGYGKQDMTSRTAPSPQPPAPLNLLTIESTCDETAAAIVTDGMEVLATVVASQDALHERFGGVVPEIASRAHVERILPVIDETLRKAGLTLDDLDAVAVANTPGLAGSLLVGLSAAKSLCVALGLPLLAVNHLQAHIYACRLASGQNVFPCVGLIVSGGHSNIYRCESPTDFTPLGGTIDDAAGEAFDKVASLLDLKYPGGPAIERAARSGNPRVHRFPRPLLDDPARLEFSFSGLKTAVRYLVAGPGKLEPGKRGAGSREQGARTNSPLPAPGSRLSASAIADIAAGFQEAVIDCLVGKAELALERTGYKTLCVGGGVAANGRFRTRLELSAAENGYTLHVPPLSLCTDNAVMGAIAIERLRAGKFEDLSLDAFPGPERASTG